MKVDRQQSNLESGPRKIVKQQHIEHNREQSGSFYMMGFKIYIFTQTKDYSSLTKILTDMAEPISKPAHINEFQINRHSLLRAKALGYSSESIIDFLKKHMKNKQLSAEVATLIDAVMNSQASTRLYLIQQQDRNYYSFEITKKELKKLPLQAQTYLKEEISEDKNKKSQIKRQQVNKTEVKRQATSNQMQEELPSTNFTSGANLQNGDQLSRWMVAQYCHNQLSAILFHRQIPVLSQKLLTATQYHHNMRRNADLYKSRGVLHCKNLKIGLKAFTKLRQYQNESLRAVVQQQGKDQIVKSGYIVLPCGAGKTLLGISICTKIKKETLVVCNSDSGAQQWKHQFQKWTEGIHSDQIQILTAKTIQEFKFSVKENKPRIFISTYSNLKTKLEGNQIEGDKDRREVRVEHEWLRLMPWGLVIFDQAQWLPAKGNSLIAKYLMAHVKIGLTATPFREDKQIQNLNYMIGPQLYVGSWRRFVDLGYLANPKCIQIRTKLTSEFDKLYRASRGRTSTMKESKQREALFQCNPNKIKTLMYLLHFHQQLNDQIIIFCDRISIIEFLAVNLNIPLLSGNTSIQDRNFVFDMFRQGRFSTLLLSRIGDQAIDLPNANVAIQINMHRGSRRQMLQRLGRIMRPKEASSSQSYNAVFYTVVTDQTIQMVYFEKRRKCLVDLGFQYDLRFCEYGETQVGDILEQDPELGKEIRQKLKAIIPNQMYFWDQMRKDD